MHRFILIFPLCFVSLITAGQGIVLEKKGIQLTAEQRIIQSDVFYDSDSKETTIRTHSVYSSRILADYGISQRVTGFVSFPFFVRSTVNQLVYNQTGNTSPGKITNSIGDAEVGLRYGIIQKKPVQAALYATLGLPVGKTGDIGSETNTPTGDGEFNQLIGLQLNYPVEALKLYASGHVAVNNRTNNFSDEIRFGFEVAYRSKLSVALHLFVIESLFNDTAPVSLNGIFSNHQELVAPGITAEYPVLKNIRATGTVAWVVAGRNTLAAPTYSLGLVWRK